MNVSFLARVAVTVISAAAAACGSPARDAEVNVADPKTVYVDVRTPGEYAEGHVAGAILIPHDQIEARWQELAEHKDTPIVLYCRTGRRSGLALDVLKEKGFMHVTNGGGLSDLAARGVPTTR